jgi:hypothetical protein
MTESTFDLKLAGELFPVTKTRLLEKLSLFQEDPALLSADYYEVKSPVSVDSFESFVRMVEGGPLTVSGGTRGDFWRLSQEFGFCLLSAACTAFMASRDRSCGISDHLDEESGCIEVAQAVRPRVTITHRGCSKTYESLKSSDEVFNFTLGLQCANNDDIVVDGVTGRGGLIEKAVKAVYLNTFEDLGGNEAMKPLLASVLWEIQWDLRWSSIDAAAYCLNRLNEIAPTAFEKARLLLLSRPEVTWSDAFDVTQNRDWEIVRCAIQMLLTEKNGKSEEAKALLLTLKESGRYGEMVWKPCGSQYCIPVTWLKEPIPGGPSSGDDSGTAAPPEKTNRSTGGSCLTSPK